MILIENLFFEDAEEDSDVYRDTEGNFYTFDGTTYNPVPTSIQRSLAKKYHEYKRMRKAEEAGKDIDELKAAHRARMNLKSTMSIETAEKEQSKAIQAALYKRKEEDEEERRIRRERAENTPAVIDEENATAGIKELLKSLKDFVSNQLYNEDQVNIEYSYEEPDPYETVDPDIFSRGRVYTHHQQEQEPEEKERPLVLFYFDRSGSFNPKSAPQKTKLGNDLQALFKGEKDLDVDTIYFSDKCFAQSEYPNAETLALRSGGNSDMALLLDIAERTRGRLANVVVLTDSDQGGVGPKVSVTGSIWLIFAGSWDPTIAKAIVKGSPETKKRLFYFTDMEN